MPITKIEGGWECWAGRPPTFLGVFPSWEDAARAMDDWYNVEALLREEQGEEDWE